ncbi:N-acetyltransferase [Longispora fulva]|uniref:GNAT superfamily N-acetyltransferase n=1 Tax=Longispora fulva TaxID=619741 RepID=A0A8J7GFF7_9ACTN|nr:GNAT family N-acetyltransferase [Longispora fulva]MBG6139698.1 GNAT superfamily N-acetyltransferase [Longispora fulva]GIG57919.1 N-acetyltransferase [Longispora fulva]
MSAEVIIRPTTIEDLPTIAAIRLATYPYLVRSLEAYQQRFPIVPERARKLDVVAVADGLVVGRATAELDIFTTEQGAAGVDVLVAAEHRRQGIGTALFAQAELHLGEIGARRVRAWVPGEPDLLNWARGLDFEPSRPVSYSKADPTALPAMPDLPPGVTLVSTADLGPEATYELDRVTVTDEPGDVEIEMIPYEEWLALEWDDVDRRHDLSVVALVDGVPAAYTVVQADQETGRSWSGGTGVLRDFRGRGLAKLVKSDSLRRVAAAGITAAYTANDDQNAPMLAVNNWLGYRVTATQWSCLRTL